VGEGQRYPDIGVVVVSATPLPLSSDKFNAREVTTKPMKFLIRLSAALVFGLSLVLGLGSAQAQALSLPTLTQSPMVLAEFSNAADAKLGEIGDKLDLNNSAVRLFRRFPGMFPTLAGKVIQNAPYQSVDDVFNIPGLSDSQKATLAKYKDQFTTTAPSNAFTSGFDRFNNGVY
jgi:photosystem II PsbU protein